MRFWHLVSRKELIMQMWLMNEAQLNFWILPITLLKRKDDISMIWSKGMHINATRQGINYGG